MQVKSTVFTWLNATAFISLVPAIISASLLEPALVLTAVLHACTYVSIVYMWVETCIVVKLVKRKTARHEKLRGGCKKVQLAMDMIQVVVYNGTCMWNSS